MAAMMGGVPVQRLTTPRRHHREICYRTKPPCGICGRRIDYTLPYLHPDSFVSDHIIPLAAPYNGPDTVENRQPAHRRCNAEKGQALMQYEIVRSGALK